MKIIFQYIIVLAGALAFMSCEKDNYEPPKSQLTGKLMYQGTPLNFQYNRVSYELYQDGFGKTGALNSTFTPEGEFSQLLFNGTYKMVVPRGQGPFLWGSAADSQDTVVINVNGNTNMDFEVLPFWMIRNPQLSAGSGNVTGTCSLEQIVTDANAKTIESVTLYLSKTVFASSDNNIAINTIEGNAITDVNNISLNAAIPTLVPAQNYVFARIGVKLAGVDDMLFAPVQKLNL